jgi:hypothetical protein
MNDKLLQSQQRLHDSLFELYMQGGLELYLAGTRGLKRDLIIQLETSALTPEKGAIIHYCAVNRWGDDDVFDECCCYDTFFSRLNYRGQCEKAYLDGSSWCCSNHAGWLRYCQQ